MSYGIQNLSSADTLLIRHEPVLHQVLLVIITTLSASALIRTTSTHSPAGRLLVARHILRVDLEAFGVDLIMSKTISTVILLILQSHLELIDLARAPLVLSTIIFNELVQTRITGCHLQALTASVAGAAARVGRAAIHRIHSAVVVVDGSYLAADRRFALSLCSLAVSES